MSAIGLHTARPALQRRTPWRRPGHTQRARGAALLAAMLTVALVASFAATALWQQWRSIEVESAERGRVQAAWILTGALDWARLILREDARSGGADYLSEPWAVPLQESRLSSFLAADKNNSASDLPENQLDAFLSGQIVDMQGRLNVLNLVDGDKISKPDVLAFARLFNLLNLPQAELLDLSQNLLTASLASNPASATASAAISPTAMLLPQRIAQLQWLGLSAATVASLSPYVSLLPVRTPLNLNTAEAEAIYASIPDLNMAQARSLVDARANSYFRSLDDAGKLLGESAVLIGQGRHSVATRFFEVRGRLRMERTVIEEHSLLQRDGLDMKTLWRSRASL